MHLKALAVAGLVVETCWAQAGWGQRQRREPYADNSKNRTLSPSSPSSVEGDGAEHVTVIEEAGDSSGTNVADVVEAPAETHTNIATSLVHSTVYVTASDSNDGAAPLQPYESQPAPDEGNVHAENEIVESVVYVTATEDAYEAAPTSAYNDQPMPEETDLPVATPIEETTAPATTHSDDPSQLPEPPNDTAALTVAPIPYASDEGEEAPASTLYATAVPTESVTSTHTLAPVNSPSPGHHDTPDAPGTAPARPVESDTVEETAPLVNASSVYETPSASQPIRVAPLPVGTGAEVRTSSEPVQGVEATSFTLYESSRVYVTAPSSNDYASPVETSPTQADQPTDAGGVFPPPSVGQGSGTAAPTGQRPSNEGTAPYTVVERTTRTHGVPPSSTQQDVPVRPVSASGQAPPSGYGQPSGYVSPTGHIPPNPMSPPGFFPTGSYSGTGGMMETITPAPSRTVPSAKCNGVPTVNVLDASLEWWWTHTYSYAISTYSILFNQNDTRTGWTLLPAATPFNITSAMELPSCTYWNAPTVVFNTTHTWQTFNCVSTPTPTAAATRLISQSAVAQANVKTGNGTLPSLQTTQPPRPAVKVPNGGNSSFPAGVPFVYFHKYEVMTANPTNMSNGSVVCPHTTSQYTLPTAVSFEYEGNEDLDGQMMVGQNVIGDVHPNFLRLLSFNNGDLNNAEAGNWAAEPTVDIVVNKVYQAQGVLAASVARSMGDLEVPSATLPPQISQEQPTTTGSGTRPFNVLSARVEVSETELDVPTYIPPRPTPRPEQPEDTGGMGGMGGMSGAGSTAMSQEKGGSGEGLSRIEFKARVESSERTLIIPVNPTATVVTASFEGQRITATAVDALSQAQQTAPPSHQHDNGQAGSGSNDQQQGGDSAGLGGLVSAIQSAIQASRPSNALDVLTAAQGQDGDDPAASAIWAGIGGFGKDSGSGNDGNGNDGNGNDGNGNDGNGKSPGSHQGGDANGQNGGSGSKGNDDGGSGSGSTGAGASDNYDGSGSGSGSGGGPVVFPVGDETVTATQGSAVVVGGQTAQPGGPAITEGGHVVSVSPDGVAVDGVNRQFVSGPTPAPVIDVDGNMATAGYGSAFVVDGQTAVPGGAPITVDGTVYSVPSNPTAVVVDGSTVPFTGSGAQPTVMEVNGQAITANNNAPVFVLPGDQTLQAGGSAVTMDDGTVLSLAPGGGALVIDGSSSSIQAKATNGGTNPASAIPYITIGSETYTANAATQYNLGPDATLTPGGTAVVSGTTVSLNEAGQEVVINGQTSTLASPMITQGAAFVVGDDAYAANAAGVYNIDGQVLTPGGEITVSGTTISLASDASSVVIDGQTETISATGEAQATITAGPILTINGQAYGANEGTTYIISGQTLTPGGAITLPGSNGAETLSLNPAANQLYDIINGTTQTSQLAPTGTEAYYRPTAAPILTIGGETFTALPGDGTSYLISGQTLTPNGEETVIIDGETFIVSLSSQATILLIEGVDANGVVTATRYQTLFPATMTRGTRYVTATITGDGEGRLEVASSTATVTGQEAGLQGAASRGGLVMGVSGLLVGVGSLVLAVCL
ncbi:hypothetical protein MBLNU230_g4059t1 [Neophaeotheca triangularis]